MLNLAEWPCAPSSRLLSPSHSPLTWLAAVASTIGRCLDGATSEALKRAPSSISAFPQILKVLQQSPKPENHDEGEAGLMGEGGTHRHEVTQGAKCLAEDHILIL